MTRQPPSLDEPEALDEYLSEVLRRCLHLGVDTPLACLVKLKITQYLSTPLGQSEWQQKTARHAERYVLSIAKAHSPMLREIQLLVTKIVKYRLRRMDADTEDIIQYVMMFLTSSSGIQYLDPEQTSRSNLVVKIKMLIIDGLKHFNSQYERSMIMNDELDEEKEGDFEDEDGSSAPSPEAHFIDHDTRSRTSNALTTAIQDLDPTKRDHVIVYHWEWLIDWLTPEALIQLCSPPLQGFRNLSDVLMTEASASRRLEVIFFSSVSDPVERAKAVSATRRSADRTKPMIRSSLEQAGVDVSWLRDEGGEDE